MRIMELSKARSFFPAILILQFFLLTGCETHLSEDELEIVGDPPRGQNMYYDVEFSYEFGGTGGDGTYRFRYIQNPEPEDDQQVDDDNPVELFIRELDGEKSGFVLHGVPRLPDGQDFDSASTRTVRYGLEISDGKTTRVQTYESSLQKNQLQLVSDGVRINEGNVDARDAQRLIDAANGGDTTICQQALDFDFEKTEVNGKTVYPLVTRVKLSQPVASRVELFYRVSSNYDENAPERSERNVGFARPNVDFLEEERSIVFEQGQGNCIIYAYVLDDAEVEDAELFTIEFFDRSGALVDFSSARAIVNLADNEPTPLISNAVETVNEGESVTIPIRLNAVHDLPVSVRITPDWDESTADEDDVRIRPENGVVVIEAGDTLGSYTIEALRNDDGGIMDDEKLVVRTDLDELFNLEPTEVTINKWAQGAGTDAEIVAREAASEAAIAFTSSEHGHALVGIQGESSQGDGIGIVRGFDSASSRINIGDSGDIQLAKAGLDVTLRSVKAFSSSSGDLLAVVANVNGKLSDAPLGIYRGGLDAAVVTYTWNEVSGYYEFEDLLQFGTEGDDVVVGSRLTGEGVLYVYGETDGLQLDGEPSEQSSSGGLDGFVYRINLTQNRIDWSRFIGDGENNRSVSLDAGRSELAVLNRDMSSDIDASWYSLDANAGQFVEGIEPKTVGQLRNDMPSTIRFDRTGSLVRMLVSSQSLLPNGGLTSSLTDDVQLLTYGVEGEFSGRTLIATTETDLASDMEDLTKDDTLVIGGETLGEFEDGGAIGSTGFDAFVAYASTEDSVVPAVTNVLQFGTASEDRVIDIEETGERKFMILWSENHTDPSGLLRYRLSPFTPEGRKLTSDP